MVNNKLDKDEKIADITHSKLNMTSYGIPYFIMQIFSLTFGAYVFYFYEAEIGLNSWIAALGFIIYAIWNAVNDPLVGIICDRTFFFTKKLGRRLPWIFFALFPSILVYVLLFTPPNVDPIEGQWIIFGWLVITTCLYDTALSFVGVNYGALFADKFRNSNERRTTIGIQQILGYIGLALGSLVPPFLIHYGDKGSYITHAWVLVLIALIGVVFVIPGLREDEETIDRNMKAYALQKERGDKISFFLLFKSALKHRNFVVFILLNLGYAILRACLIGSIQYELRYVLLLPAMYSSIIMVGYFVSSLIATPIWIYLAKKIDNNRKVIIITAILTCIFTAPMTFLTDVLTWIILLILWGIGVSGMFVVNSPVFADVIDEGIALSGKRNEGLYNGVIMFIGRFSIVVQAIIFATVHSLTGFVEEADVQNEMAKWGIQLTLGVIPMLFLLVGTLIFWKFYNLTPEKIKEIKVKLEELNL